MKENKQPKLIKLGENQYCFEDIYGKRSEIYYYAQPYNQGFAPVKRTAEDKEVLYRDMVGNLSTDRHTIRGSMFYWFAHGNTSFDNLPAVCFTNENFYEGVKMLLLDKLAMKIESKSQKGQHINISRIKQQKDRIIDMCEEKRLNGFQVMRLKLKVRKKARKASYLADEKPENSVK